MFTVKQIKTLISTNSLSRFYNDRAWRRLAHSVLTEQHNECQLCRQQGKYSKAVIVHHVNHLRKRPDLAYSRTYTDTDGAERTQLLALCHDCHERVHGRGAYGSFGKTSNRFKTEEKW